NQTLTASFGGTALLITNERSGHSNIKGDLKGDFPCEIATLHEYIGGKFSATNSMFAANDTNITQIHTKIEVMKELIFKSAVAKMKGLEGNKTELKEFVKCVDECYDPLYDLSFLISRNR
ncbi:hypothetical protein L873DRAFT_1710218, partial [Choiromyces venosus 120613-1]